MSRNGIRSLVIALAIGVVFWAGLAVEIMHFTGGVQWLTQFLTADAP